MEIQVLADGIEEAVRLERERWEPEVERLRAELVAAVRKGVQLGLDAAVARICDAEVVPDNGHATLDNAEFAVRDIDPATVVP